jgi:hypothetical protein
MPQVPKCHRSNEAVHPFARASIRSRIATDENVGELLIHQKEDFLSLGREKTDMQQQFEEKGPV